MDKIGSSSSKISRGAAARYAAHRARAFAKALAFALAAALERAGATAKACVGYRRWTIVCTAPFIFWRFFRAFDLFARSLVPAAGPPPRHNAQ